MCTVILPLDINLTAVNKYINTNQYQLVIRGETLRMRISRIPSMDHLRGGGLYSSHNEIFPTSLGSISPPWQPSIQAYTRLHGVVPS